MRSDPLDPMEDLEAFWSDLLSADPDRVRAAFEPLSREERRGIRSHLGRMATEAGWTASQRERARAALAALADVLE